MAVDSVVGAGAQSRVAKPLPVGEDERRTREPPPEPRPKPASRLDGLGSRVDQRA